ncbi:hypothetical protein RI367_007253 [Sorochytrium milnesiophthora]
MVVKTATDTIKYLKTIPALASATNAALLTQGVGSFVWRVHFSSPLSNGQSTAIVKYAEPHVNFGGQSYADLERMVQHEAMQLFAEGGPLSQLTVSGAIRVPEVLNYDPDHKVLVIQDAGERSITLKEYGPSCTHESAVAIGSALGTFVRDLHKASVPSPAFQNLPAKRLLRSIMYDRLQVTADSLGGDTELAERVTRRARAFGDEYAELSKEFTHGDLWPGNVLVQLDSQGAYAGTVWVVDWELSRFGSAALDIAQFAAETHLLAVYRNAIVAELTKAFLTSYRGAELAWSDRHMRICCIHFGVHILLWMPLAGWTEDSKERQPVLLAAAEYVDKADDSTFWKSSIFQHLQ